MTNDLRHKSKSYYRIRKMVRVMFWTGLLVALYYIATHLNWVDDGYCWGTMEKFYLGEGK
jgi:hypothetical protein